MRQEIQDFVNAAQAAFATINTALDGIGAGVTAMAASVANIAKDEAGLAKMITDLQDQLLSSGLSQSDKDALTAVAAQATAMAGRSQQSAMAVSTTADQVKALADSIPDPPPPPAL